MRQRDIAAGRYMAARFGQKVSRRAFAIGALAAVTAPIHAKAQAPSRVYRLALWNLSRAAIEMREESGLPQYRAFFAELRRLGFDEGQNLKTAFYSGTDRSDWNRQAKEVVDDRPDLVVPNGSVASQLLLDITRAIPIVCPGLPDPVVAGLVSSLARPGGSLTGFTLDGGIDVYGLRLQLLKETVPNAARLGYLTSAAVWAQTGRQTDEVLRQAATAVGTDVWTEPMDLPYDNSGYRAAFSRLSARGIQALLVGLASAHQVNRSHIIRLATEARLPVLYSYRECVVDGGLMASATDLVENYRKTAHYVARIFRGENPGDLPIEQPSKYDLVVSPNAAKAIGIEIPFQILARATEILG